MLNNTN